MLLTILLLASGFTTMLNVSAVISETATVETGPRGVRVVTNADEPPFVFAQVPMWDGTTELVAIGPEWQNAGALYAQAQMKRLDRLFAVHWNRSRPP